MSIQIGRLTDEITRQLRRYSQVVSEDVDQITDELTSEGVEKIKNNIRNKKLIRSGSYVKGWTKKRLVRVYLSTIGLITD